MKTPILVSTALLGAIALPAAGAQPRPVSDAAFQESLRGAFAAALAKPPRAAEEALAAGPAQAQAPAATDPCAEHRELEGIRYTFRLQRQGQDPVVVVFTYSRCSVEDRTADGDPVTPVATRTYTGNFGGYSLHLSHELGDNSVGLGLTQSENGGATFLIAASFDSKPAADLTRGTVNLGDVRMMDWRVPRGQELRGTGSLEAAAAR